MLMDSVYCDANSFLFAVIWTDSCSEVSG